MRETALVTGASSGIGRAFSQVLAEHGYDLILTARREDALERIAVQAVSRGVEVEVYPADLTDPDAVSSLERLIAERCPDFFVNNAGVGRFGRFAELSRENPRLMIDVDVLAYTRLLHATAASMAGRGTGRILNVASVASFQPGPLLSVYYAAKVFNLRLSEGIAEELRGTGVTVTALCPGPTRSAFHEASGMNVNEAGSASMPDPLEVARFGYRMAMRGKRVAVHGARFRVATFLERFLPRRVLTAGVYALQRRRL
ncbi:MAG: SDR family NAD(P)-dependent oxidoreductase [Spirochaetaceae bacterium]